eukprot:RCo005694
MSPETRQVQLLAVLAGSAYHRPPLFEDGTSPFPAFVETRVNCVLTHRELLKMGPHSTSISSSFVDSHTACLRVQFFTPPCFFSLPLSLPDLCGTILTASRIGYFPD